MSFKIHRYSVKFPDAVFADRSTFSEEENQILENFVNNFVKVQDGYIANSISKTIIDDNTIRLTSEFDSTEDKELVVAKNYIRAMGKSNNEYRIAYTNMLHAKGERLDVSKCYTEVEYSNGHIQIYNFAANN